MSNRFSGLSGISQLANPKNGVKSTSASTAGDREIPLAEIVSFPFQKRTYFDDEALSRLMASIKESGCPSILVRPRPDGKFEGVYGERRYLACQKLGFTSIPAKIKELDDRQAKRVAAQENLARENLNPIEEAEAALMVLQDDLVLTSRKEVVKVLYAMQNAVKGKSTYNVVGRKLDQDIKTVNITLNSIGCALKWDSFIQNRLLLFNLPEEVLGELQKGKISYTKAQAIAKVKDEQLRVELLATAVEQGLTLSQIKEKVALIKQEGGNSEQMEESPKQYFGNLTKRVRQAQPWKWEPKTRKKYEKLMGQLETLLIEVEKQAE